MCVVDLRSRCASSVPCGEEGTSLIHSARLPSTLHVQVSVDYVPQSATIDRCWGGAQIVVDTACLHGRVSGRESGTLGPFRQSLAELPGRRTQSDSVLL